MPLICTQSNAGSSQSLLNLRWWVLWGAFPHLQCYLHAARPVNDSSNGDTHRKHHRCHNGGPINKASLLRVVSPLQNVSHLRSLLIDRFVSQALKNLEPAPFQVSCDSDILSHYAWKFATHQKICMLGSKSESFVSPRTCCLKNYVLTHHSRWAYMYLISLSTLISSSKNTSHPSVIQRWSNPFKNTPNFSWKCSLFDGIPEIKPMASSPSVLNF